ncbi:ImmA/IrrE family metallo-endopeptidase [Rhizohabitans arisaemae]|uniref:ImmA/IrrE family metallo-endopeptidase n=1 Tax=Rhizohabitans arisaemae TaxID=2720610 RepID=UPI0024B155B7|nr:ImmA/IrrE family metallo-endopeptidase [Rhizohabitans arisaemae]
MTQTDVANAMTRALSGDGTVSQGYVSKAETGHLAVVGDRLALYAQALRYPSRLLCFDADAEGTSVGLIHHRKRASLTTTSLRTIHAQLNLARLQLRNLVRTVEALSPPVLFEHIKVDDYDTAEDAAQAIRGRWGLPSGPVESVVRAIESAGGLVLRRQLAGRELDAVSQWPTNENPIFVLNTRAPADRQRFTLSHELGHVAMHVVPNSRQEQQADQFASEFLMPARDIGPDLKADVDLECLYELKKKWRVSMAALLRRAHTLGAVSDWRYRQLNIELSTLGYRTTEPQAFPPEKPALVPALINHLRREQQLTVVDLAHLAGLHEKEFVDFFLTEAGAP